MLLLVKIISKEFKSKKHFNIATCFFALNDFTYFDILKMYIEQNNCSMIISKLRL